MSNKNYILNLDNKKIHFIDYCYPSKNIKYFKKYYTIEEAEAEYPKKIKLCKKCFECKGE